MTPCRRRERPGWVRCGPIARGALRRREHSVTTVLVCDDSPLAREALRRAVATVPGVDRVSVAGSGEEGLVRFGADRPDLVLLDVRMPGIGGVEAARRMLAVAPHTGVIMMTMAEDVEGVARAVNAGARGYLVKDASREELTTMVTQALADAAAARSMPKMAMDTEAGLPTLTERELQVLRGMGRGRSNAEIGKELYLSEDTVKTHARRLFRKLGAADRAQAVAKGFRWGLVR
jgi:DNA-binding NarL/FixJ family response regulator